MENELRFVGSNFMRQRLILSLLSGRPVRIMDIRSDYEMPGLRDYEVKILKLIEQLTNGTRININETGTELLFAPGMLRGGRVEVDCGAERNISYFLELLFCLAPFVKESVRAVLRGITNDDDDPSVDALIAAWLPLVRRFLPDDDGLELKLTRRGLRPDGGGEVRFGCPRCSQLRPLVLERAGKVRRVRGVAFVCRVSPAFGNRLIDAAKAALSGLISDVYITLDTRKGAAAGSSPGYGLVLTAETTEGVVYTAEAMSKPKKSDESPRTPEHVGATAATALLEEIFRGGCVDSTAQATVALFMALCGQKDVSKVLMGPLSNYTVYALRHIREFVDVVFKIEQPKADDVVDGSRDKAKLICVGTGFANLNKVML